MKLTRRSWPSEEIESLLDELTEAGLQSDTRFAESFARSRIERAHGPMRIRADLSQRGVEKGECEAALKTLSPDWAALAAAWYERRYRTPPDSPREKARRMQALVRRGFLHEHIRGLLEP